jgi:outer membrane protein W
MPPLRFASLVVAALLLAVPPTAFAQEASSVSLGLGITVTTPRNDAAATDIGAGIAIRLRGRGMSPSIGMSWFTTRVHTDVAGQQVEMGRIAVRPLMVSVGYSREMSRLLSWYTSLAGGIALGHVRETGALKQAYARLGVGQVGVKMADAFAWRVNTGVWFDLGNDFGLNFSVGYLGVQPGITITTDAGATRRSVDLGSVVTSIGFTYGIF